MYIGYHVQREGQTLLESLRREYKYISEHKPTKSNVVFQVFIAGPRSFKLHKLTEDEISGIADFLFETNTLLVFHGTYLDRPFDGDKASMKSIINQMTVAEDINKSIYTRHKDKTIDVDHVQMPYVIGPIIHMSKVSRSKGIGPLKDLNHVLICLETDAYKMPQENTDKDNIAELDANIRSLVHWKHQTIIFDTAHLYECGINLHEPHVMQSFLRTVSTLVHDLDIRPGFHLNDSYTELGSGNDRHEVLGKGHIFKGPGGKLALSHLLEFLKKHDSFAILENPPDDIPHGLRYIKSVLGEN